MMKCREYIFRLTSGQLEEDASLIDRGEAALHRLMCARCRAFTRNDQALDDILRQWEKRLGESDPPPPAA